MVSHNNIPLSDAGAFCSRWESVSGGTRIRRFFPPPAAVKTSGISCKSCHPVCSSASRTRTRAALLTPSSAHPYIFGDPAQWPVPSLLQSVACGSRRRHPAGFEPRAAGWRSLKGKPGVQSKSLSGSLSGSGSGAERDREQYRYRDQIGSIPIPIAIAIPMGTA